MADHPGRQAVTEEVGGAAVSRVYPRLGERLSHKVADRIRACQTDAQRFHSQEDPARGTAATVLTEVERQRLSNV